MARLLKLTDKRPEDHLITAEVDHLKLFPRTDLRSVGHDGTIPAAFGRNVTSWFETLSRFTIASPRRG